MQSRARSINANLRRRSDDKLVEVKRINGELAAIAERAVRQAERVVRNARRKLASSDGSRRAEPVRRSTGWSGSPSGHARSPSSAANASPATTPDGATRVVSLHDPDARPIVKGRLGRPVEFGYKAQIVDNEDGVIVDHNIELGNPPDAPQLVPAIERVKRRTGRAPRAVTADRGYGDRGVEDDLRDLGVRYPAIPTKGRPNAARRQIEQRRAFRKTRPMAHRQRGTDQLRETRLRAQPHPLHRHRRRPNLVRPRRVQPQPHQDRSPHRHRLIEVDQPTPANRRHSIATDCTTRPTRPTRPTSSGRSS